VTIAMPWTRPDLSSMLLSPTASWKTVANGGSPSPRSSYTNGPAVCARPRVEGLNQCFKWEVRTNGAASSWCG
jgi:hypothetical protein